MKRKHGWPYRGAGPSRPRGPRPQAFGRLPMRALTGPMPNGGSDADSVRSGDDAGAVDEEYRDLRKKEPRRLAVKLGWMGPEEVLSPEEADKSSDLTPLERLRRLEELSWETGSKELRNLAWLLRLKQAEAAQRAERSEGRGDYYSRTAKLLLVAAVVFGAVEVGRLVLEDFHNVSTKFWFLLVAMGAAIVFLLAAATLLFRVAAQHQSRAREYAADADETRKIEGAVRLAQASGESPAAEQRAATALVAAELIRSRRGGGGPDLAELSFVPDTVRELTALLLKTKAGQGGNG